MSRGWKKNHITASIQIAVRTDGQRSLKRCSFHLRVTYRADELAFFLHSIHNRAEILLLVLLAFVVFLYERTFWGGKQKKKSFTIHLFPNGSSMLMWREINARPINSNLETWAPVESLLALPVRPVPACRYTSVGPKQWRYVQHSKCLTHLVSKNKNLHLWCHLSSTVKVVTGWLTVRRSTLSPWPPGQAERPLSPPWTPPSDGTSPVTGPDCSLASPHIAGGGKKNHQNWYLLTSYSAVLPQIVNCFV